MKKLNNYFKDWEGYVSDDYEFEVSDKGEFLSKMYTQLLNILMMAEYIHFKLIYNDENETEEGYLAVASPLSF